MTKEETDGEYKQYSNQKLWLHSTETPATGDEEMSFGMQLYTNGTDYGMYSYDNFNRLSEYTNGVTTASYTYGADNLRTSKTVNGVTTAFHWDGQNLSAQTSQGGEYDYFAYDAGGVLSANIDNAPVLYLYEHNSVSATANTSGAISSNTYAYDAFGNQKNSNVDDTNPFRYCGEYYDAETGLIYLRNRYYDTTTGRFVTEDPVKDGLNWYVYCGNDPVGYVDPWGYWASPYVDANGVYHSDPDYEEFYGTIAYQALSDLTESYALCQTDAERQVVTKLAQEVRNIARSLNNDLDYKPMTGDTYYQLSATEIVLANGYKFETSYALYAGLTAKQLTETTYGESWSVGTEADAYRHGVWSLLLTHYAGAKFSSMWLNAHEFGTSDNLQTTMTDIGSTRYQQTQMDLFNNSVGIYQASILDRTIVFTVNGVEFLPVATDASRAISNRIDAGGMVILN